MTLKEKIRLAREDNRTRRAIDIADDLGCSRERVRQVLKMLGLETTVPSYVPTKNHNRGPMVQGRAIRVAPARAPIPPAINELTGTKVCPRCDGIFLYLSDEDNSWDVRCFTCGQLIGFRFKYRVIG